MPYLRTNNEMPIIPGYASGDIVTIDAAAAPLNKCIVDILPVQSGTGDPSPTNIRPISGWSSVNVTRCGVNLWDEEWELGIINSTTGEDEANNSYIRSKGYTRVEANMSVYCVTSASLRLVFYDKDKAFVGIANGNNTVVNIPNDSKYLRFYVNNSYYGTTYKNDISINYPSSDTSYHAYNGTTANIPLGSTYYGGSLNVTTGVLTVTKGYIAEYDGETLPSDWICDRAVYASGTTPPTGSQVVYTLATPTTVQLTPTEVKTILGNNNIFADSGEVDIIYIRRSGT